MEPANDGSAAARKNMVELWGNEKTMNMNPVLHSSILASPYFRNDLYSFKTYHEVIDEIYNRVDHLEPILPGGDNHPSSAFCLLYKLFTLRLTEKQLKGILNHADSPYIRALGFLYLRFATPPKGLWDRFESFMMDPEPIKVRWDKHAPKVSMGQFVRELITDTKFINTMLPRIPVPVHKELLEKLKTKGLAPKADERAVGHAGTMLNGVPEAEGEDGANDDDNHAVEEGDSKSKRSHSASPKRRSSRSRSRSHDRRDRDRSRERRRSDSKDRSRGRSHSRSRDRRRRSRSHERSRGRSRSRSRSRERARDSRRRSRSRSRGRHERDSRDRDRDRDRDERPVRRDYSDRDEREGRQSGSRDRR
eukprot:Opistho-2@19258